MMSYLQEQDSFDPSDGFAEEDSIVARGTGA